MKTSMFLYKYNNKDIPVHVSCARQRNIYYRYKEDGFHVSCPYLTRQKDIVRGLDKFAKKLVDQYVRAHSNFSFEEDYLWLLGDKVSLKFLNIENNEDLSAFLKKYAQKTIENLVRKNEEIMGISKPFRVAIRNTQRQFGSNSKTTHTLSFQISLIHYSEEIIESVVIHELAHEFQRNHSDKFYNIVYKYCPNYKAVQRKLKKGIHKWLIKSNLAKTKR